jgi:hypothetical protein
MDQLWVILPFLAFLACPLMMVLCFVGMRRMVSPAHDTPTQTTEQSEERVAELQRQLASIEAELAELSATKESESSPSPVQAGGQSVVSSTG